MSLQIHPIKAFTDNYIWMLINQSNHQAIVIDPGQAAPVIEYLNANGLELTAIWITHHHHDHTGGVAELQEHFPMTHIVAHNDHGVAQDQAVKEGSTVNAWCHAAQVWEVAGHTANHLAYVLDIDGKKHIFCGDTLFSGGCGRVFTGTIEQLFTSISRLASVSEDSLFYPAHEYTQSNLRFGLSIEPDNIAIQDALNDATAKAAQGIPTLPVSGLHEHAVNVFLRTTEPSVIAGASAKMSLPDDKPLTVFAALRELKNNF